MIMLPNLLLVNWSSIKEVVANRLHNATDEELSLLIHYYSQGTIIHLTYSTFYILTSQPILMMTIHFLLHFCMYV